MKYIIRGPNCSWFCFCDKMNGVEPDPLISLEFFVCFCFSRSCQEMKGCFEATVSLRLTNWRSKCYSTDATQLHCFLALDTLIENYQASRTYWNCRYAVTIALFRVMQVNHLEVSIETKHWISSELVSYYLVPRYLRSSRVGTMNGGLISVAHLLIEDFSTF